jgi:hypothetical protein
VVKRAFEGREMADLISERRPPLLLYSLGNYNLVAYGRRFLAIPQSLGPIDLERENVIGRLGVMVAADLQTLEAGLRVALDSPA